MRSLLREVSGTDKRTESCLTWPRKFFFQRFDNLQWLVYTENRNDERYLTHDITYSEGNGRQQECDASAYIKWSQMFMRIFYNWYRLP